LEIGLERECPRGGAGLDVAIAPDGAIGGAASCSAKFSRNSPLLPIRAHEPSPARWKRGTCKKV